MRDYAQRKAKQKSDMLNGKFLTALALQQFPNESLRTLMQMDFASLCEGLQQRVIMGG
ncbi:MAG: hypothetical protein KA974_09995 [Saprospiraceae bacterium]|nr:hypothetical protein [Saprospiraceae bacterium]